MKKLFFTLCAAVISMAAMAQDSFVATLTHDGNLTKTYYGEDALISAYDDAYEGDVITLSAGTFNCPTAIEKAIIIRGVGMETATEKVNVTKLSGSFTWTVPENPEITPLLEGVSVLANSISFVGFDTNSKAKISKCSLYGVNFRKGTFFVTHCIEQYSSVSHYDISMYSQEETSVCINNCKISGIKTSYNNRALVENSIIQDAGSSMKNSTITNSIFYMSPVIDASNIVRYCIATPYSANQANKVFQNLGAESSNNTEVESISQIVQDFSNGDYHLTETAAATYLGNDGTEVGIYGGSNPFNPIPTNPKVRKLVVDTTPGSNGKLNVNIEIE